MKERKEDVRMSIIKAIIMGIVQGATEFLPVSSSGHLVIFGKLLNLQEPDITFEILLHVGTLLAIFAVYYKDIFMLIKEFFGMIADIPKGKINIDQSPYRKLILLIITASVPTAIMGLLFEDLFESLFSSLFAVGVALLITGFLMYIVDKIVPGNKKEQDIQYKNAFVIGFFQGFAITPGISRSGSTIVAGLINGLEKEMAIRFSFLISIPAVVGASIFKLKDAFSDPEKLQTITSTPYLLGTLTSAIVGFICIKILIRLLKERKFHYFAYYCWTVGILSIIANFILT
jgi:undecaprenyl-diphosphatase